MNNLIALITISFISYIQTSGRIITFTSDKQLLHQSIKEFNLVDLNFTVSKLNFGELNNYNIEKKTLNLTNVTFGAIELYFTDPDIVIKDNQLRIEGDEESGYILFDLKYFIEDISDGSKNLLAGYANFTIKMKNLELRKNYEYINNKFFITGSISVDMEITEIKTDTDKKEYNDMIKDGINKLFIDNKNFEKISSELLKDVNDFYKQFSENLEKEIISIESYFPNKKYEISLLNSARPVIIRNERPRESGIVNNLSGNISNLKQSEIVNEFKDFKMESTNVEIFLHKSLFIDIINDIMKDYSVKGILNEPNIFNLPYSLSMPYLSQIMPEVVNTYSLAEYLNLHYAFYDAKLIFGKEKVTGLVTLDCTIYTKNIIKQIFSFDAEISFELNIPKDQELYFNVYAKFNEVENINIRNSIGYVRKHNLKRWLEISLKNNETYKLLSKKINLETGRNITYYEDGILLY